MGKSQTKIIGVIPARFQASRFPGKMLAPILGKPLLQWVIEGCQGGETLTELIVATDNLKVAELVESLGFEAVMTSENCPSGSDRVFAAVKNRQADIVLNIQGDEPLITNELLDKLAQPLLDDPGVKMSTLGRLLKEGDLESATTAKIILNRAQEAIYFSRLPIPFSRVDASQFSGLCLKHIGLYGYRMEFLQEFCQQGVTELEKAEGLEQLRALVMGARIRVVKVDHDSWGVDTPEDIDKVERRLRDKR